MKIKAIFSLIACGLVASTTAAVSLPGPVLTAACSGATEIFYVNGVFADQEDAKDSLNRIIEAYEPLASTYGEIEFESNPKGIGGEVKNLIKRKINRAYPQ